MKHIRNFRNFSINELQDWAVMPVDVHKGMSDLYGQVGKEIKSYLGSKYNQFIEIITKISGTDTFGITKQQAMRMLESARSFFGKDTETLSSDSIRRKLDDEFSDNLKESKWDETNPYVTHSDEEEVLGNKIGDVKGGILQKVGSILQTVFGINLLSFGLLGSVISTIFGLLISPVFSIIISLVAILIVHLIRKLHKMITSF